MGDKERMVWSPVWLNVLQTIVWLPFKSHAQSSFDKSVLLSNPHSKMVGFCFGLAIPTLVWYTTLVQRDDKWINNDKQRSPTNEVPQNISISNAPTEPWLIWKEIGNERYLVSSAVQTECMSLEVNDVVLY